MEAPQRFGGRMPGALEILAALLVGRIDERQSAALARRQPGAHELEAIAGLYPYYMRWIRAPAGPSAVSGNAEAAKRGFCPRLGHLRRPGTSLCLSRQRALECARLGGQALDEYRAVDGTQLACGKQG